MHCTIRLLDYPNRVKLVSIIAYNIVTLLNVLGFPSNLLTAPLMFQIVEYRIQYIFTVEYSKDINIISVLKSFEN